MKIVIRKGHDEDIDDNYRWNENLKRGIRNDFENLFQEGISRCYIELEARILWDDELL